MPYIDLEIGNDGEEQVIVNYTGGASVEACLRDDVDANYVWGGGPGIVSLWYPQAHGLPDGTTVNSVTGYWRGCRDGSGATYFRYKRQGDAAATNSTSYVNSAYPTWGNANWTIPAPTGGWDLTKLENLQFGLLCQGGGLGNWAYATRVFVRVDYTEPAAAFIPQVRVSP